MSSISITQLYELLSIKLGKETAENLTTFIEQKINSELEGRSQTLATREDLAALKEDVVTLKGELKTEMATIKSEMIKWMFIFWVGQMVGTFGFILLFLKK